MKTLNNLKQEETNLDILDIQDNIAIKLLNKVLKRKLKFDDLLEEIIKLNEPEKFNSLTIYRTVMGELAATGFNYSLTK